MKKNIFAVLSLLVAMVCTVSAQNNAKFNKGDLAFNLNYGIGAFTSGGFNDNILQHSFGVSGEYGIMDGMINGKGSIGVGGQLGFGFGSKDFYGVDVKATRIRIATRGVFHYQFTPAFDTYGGISFCFVDIDKYKIEDASYSFSEDDYSFEVKSEDLEEKETNFIEPRAFVGARYMLSDSFGLNLETSWDRFAFISFGATFKF